MRVLCIILGILLFLAGLGAVFLGVDMIRDAAAKALFATSYDAYLGISARVQPVRNAGISCVAVGAITALVSLLLPGMRRRPREKKAPSPGRFACACGALLEPGDKFCLNCGRPVGETKTCHGCGAEMEDGALFCGACGAGV